MTLSPDSSADTAILNKSPCLGADEAFFRGLVENTPVVLWVMDLDRTFIYVNPAIEALSGYTPREWCRGRFRDRCTPDDGLTCDQVIEESISSGPNGKEFAFEARVTRRDGSSVDVGIQGRAVFDDVGGPVYLQGTMRDASDRRQREEEKGHLTRFPAQNPNPVIRLSSAGEVLYANDAGRRILDSPDIELGYAVHSEWGDVVRRAFEAGTALLEERTIGSRDWQVALVPFPNLGYVNLYATDITELKQMHDQLERRVAKRTEELRERTARSERINKAMINLLEDMREKNKELAEANRKLESTSLELKAANRELESFSYSVSHDLRAPLRSIDGFSQVLIEDFGELLGETGRDDLRCLREASQEMGQLIDDLLALSRTSRQPLNREEIDLGEVASDVFRELCDREPHRRVSFSVGGNLRVSADRRLMRVVLVNLIGNAWKFTGGTSAPRIEVGTTDSEDSAVYFVRDNGAGFDMRYAEKLFGPFQRLHRADEFPGTGIGLATVQRVIRRHGGTVHAVGKPGEGATFSFTLGNKTEQQLGME